MMPKTDQPNPIEEQSALVSGQLQRSDEYLKVLVGEAELELTHLAKPLWSTSPEHPDQVNVTKRELLQYYISVAPKLLPYLQDRPLTIKRFPEGINGPSFMQRHMENLPDFVQTVEICTDATGNNERFLLCQDLASLLWLVNQDTIEFHPWHSRINPENTGLPTIFINSTGTLEMSVLNYPDWLVFDIDPNQDVADQSTRFESSRQAALLIHRFLDQLQIKSLVKLSGKRGVHIFIPLARKYPFDQVRQVAKRLSDTLADQHEETFTTEWHIDKRQGKVFLDWQQNARGKSMAAAYSLRATETASISMPISWEEVATIQPDHFTVSAAKTALATPDDFWSDVIKHAQELPTELL